MMMGRRSAAIPAGARGARRLLAALLRLSVVVAALYVAQSLVSRGTLVAPISLFNSAASTNGFYAATHLVPVAAALLGAAALAGLLDGGWWVPRRAVALGLLLPLAAYAAATLHAADPFDARRALFIAIAWSAAFLALVDALAGIGRGVAARPAAASRVARLLVLAAVALGGLRLAVMAFRQFLSGVPTQVAWTGLKLAAIIPIRVTATFHNPNVFAAACLLFIGAAAALALVPARGLPRAAALVLGLAVVAAGTGTLVLTFSRAAYLALGGACVLTFLLLPRARRKAALPVLLAAVVPFVVLALRVPGVVFRLHSISIANGGDVTSRFFSWFDTLRVWLAHPLLGAGPQGMQPLYAPFFPLHDFGTWVLINVPGGIDNDPLQWLAEAGAVGGAALAAGILLWLHAGWRRWARLRLPRRAVLAPMVAILAGVVAQSLLETTLFMLPIQALVVVLAALCVDEADLARRVAVPRRPAAAGLTGATAVAAVGVAAALALGLHAQWPGDAAFLRGWAALQRGGGVRVAARDFRRAAALQPQNSRDWASLADTYVLQAYRLVDSAPATALRDAAGAGAALAHALAINPYDAATWDLAALWEGLRGQPLAQACAEQWAVRDNSYDSGFVLRLAADLAVLSRAHGLPPLAAGRYAMASLRDTGYATRLLPLVLKVYREHRYIHSIPAVTRTMTAADATWQAASAGAAPRLPDLPLNTATCAPALTGTGLPWPHVRVPG